MSDQIIVVDPAKLDPMKDGGPYFVWSDHSSGIVEWGIKFRTKADYNHVMLMPFKGQFVSQGNTYSAVPISRYMKKGNRLEFWKLRNITSVEQQLLLNLIHRDLKAPWWQKMYDWIGILGQAVGVPIINGPTKYCSERSVSYLIALKRVVMEQKTARLLDVPLSDIKVHPSPGELLDFFKKHPVDFEYVGYWHHA